MSEEKIQELLKSLFSLEYEWKSSSDSYTSKIINKEGKVNVENIIRSFLLDNRDEKLGVLEAKVFMYEEMISKSTFAPMLVVKEEIIEPIEEVSFRREMVFTQRQIENLQSKVYEITGEGDVIELFKELLCVNN